jgi:hypothetical protein
VSESLDDKRRYVAAQEQTRPHSCHWPGCTVQVAPALWGCKPHWMRLPQRLRQRIWAAYQPGQERTLTPSDEYLEAAKAVDEWIAAHSGPERGGPR